MMKLTYRRAILSVCEDLRNPNDQPLPIGVLLVGDLAGSGTMSEGLDGSRWAGAIVLQPSFVDPFLAEHITGALAIVKDQIDGIVEKTPDVPTEEILHGLYSMLRNTLSVTSIGDEQTVEVDAASEELYGSAVFEVASRELKSELEEVLRSLEVRLAALAASTPTPPEKKRRSAVRAEQSEVWAIPA